MITQKSCHTEPQVIETVKSGFTGGEVSAHLDSCASCRETARVVRFLQTSLVDERNAQNNLPAAGFLWWKSKIIEKRERAERIGQPILIAQIAGFAVAFATLVWLFTSKSSQSDWFDTAVKSAFISIESLIFPLVAGILCFAVVCLLLVLGMRRYFLEK